MSVPSGKISVACDYYLALEAESQGISVDSLQTEDLQRVALGIRLAVSNPDDLAVANALDELSTLGDPEMKYLSRLSGQPAAA